MEKGQSFPKQNDRFKNLQILYEDNHLIAVNKPAGLLVQGDSSGQVSLLELTKEYIKKKYQKPGNVFLGLIHRLDRPVGGIVLLAKTSKGAARISEQLRARQITKIYWAMVHGTMSPQQGMLSSYLVENEKGSKLTKKSDPRAKEAILSYRTLASRGSFSLLELTLHTGRKHQIRLQLATSGCPIVGDVKYGAPYSLEDASIRLLAKSLSFQHPTKKEESITIETDLPSWAIDFLEIF